MSAGCFFRKGIRTEDCDVVCAGSTGVLHGCRQGEKRSRKSSKECQKMHREGQVLPERQVIEELERGGHSPKGE